MPLSSPYRAAARHSRRRMPPGVTPCHFSPPICSRKYPSPSYAAFTCWNIRPHAPAMASLHYHTTPYTTPATHPHLPHLPHWPTLQPRDYHKPPAPHAPHALQPGASPPRGLPSYPPTTYHAGGCAGGGRWLMGDVGNHVGGGGWCRMGVGPL